MSSQCVGPVLTHQREFLAAYEDENHWQRQVYGTRQWIPFCKHCGRKGSALRYDNEFAAALPKFPKQQAEAMMKQAEESEKKRWEEESRIRQENWEAERAAKIDQMRADYAEYRKTPEWAERRKMAISRDKGICQGCLKAPAEVVHHLTYERIGNELMFDLVSLCRTCHDRAHPEKATD